MNEYIKGTFFGALIICLLMLNFPKSQACTVEIGKGNVTHIMVGAYSE